MTDPAQRNNYTDAIDLARRVPVLFSELILANTGARVSRHPLQSLMIRLMLHCYFTGRHLLIQGPPEHAKTSTIIPTLLWILAQDTTQKIGLISADNDLSEENLIRIRKALLSPVTRDVFPHIKPDYKASFSGQKGEWSKSK